MSSSWSQNPKKKKKEAVSGEHLQRSFSSLKEEVWERNEIEENLAAGCCNSLATCIVKQVIHFYNWEILA